MSKVDAMLAWLIPRRCVLCNQASGPESVCPECRQDLPWLPVSLPLGPGTGQPARLTAALSYEYPVDRMITAAKFHRQLHFALALGELLARSLGGASVRPDLLVPVPLHRRRLAQRGYNQALEIARPVSDILGVQLAPQLCQRLRDTPEQTGLKAVERRRNLRNAFAVTKECAGARIAILDDVITTGSTAAAVAQAFRRAGAAHVEVWAVARVL